MKSGSDALVEGYVTAGKLSRKKTCISLDGLLYSG